MQRKWIVCLTVVVMSTVMSQVCSWSADKVVVVPLGGGSSIEPYSPLPATSPQINNYSVNTYDITDETTGLIWEKNESAVNMSWEAAWAYCQNQTTGGRDTWRLPSIEELSSLIYYDTHSPAINSLIFAGTTSTGYWSSTTCAGNASAAWITDFSAGHILAAQKGNLWRARCVRGQHTLHNKFIYKTSLTLEDYSTGLTWQRQNNNIQISWNSAILFCNNLLLDDYTDWRLPNIKELFSIVEPRSFNPSIDLDSFPASVSKFYWSSTPSSFNPSYAWAVNFSNGISYDGDTTGTHYVRCVR